MAGFNLEETDRDYLEITFFVTVGWRCHAAVYASNHGLKLFVQDVKC